MGKKAVDNHLGHYSHTLEMGEEHDLAWDSKYIQATEQLKRKALS